VNKGGVNLVEVKMAEDVSFISGNAPMRSLPFPAAKTAASPPPDVSHVVVRSTCRSGTRIESPADCIVLGDVNPGAEVIAIGDVIIFGLLKGIAHAGATGNRSARIWALSIEPAQIRIADLVALPPQSSKATRKRYEVAEVQEGMIEVLTY
jgi:septum site-determining protein MinC